MTIFRIDTDSMVASARTRSTQVLLKNLGSRIKALEPRMKAAVLKAKRLHDGTSTALKSPDANTLRLLAKGCAAELEVFRGFMTELVALEFQLQMIEKDSEFVADHIDGMLPLSKGLSNEKIDCTAWIGQLQADQQRTEQAALGVAKNESELEKAVLTMEKSVTAYREVLRNNAKELEGSAARALAAAKSGERQEYATAADSVTRVGESVTKATTYVIKQCVDQAADFRKKFGPRMDNLPALRDLGVVRAEAEKAAAEVARTVAKVKAAEPKGVDARRAAKVLLLEKYEADLAKILNGPPAGHEKALEALVKKAGRSGSGRVLLAMLVKARVL